jgi:gluconate 2-dehydrogenase gamma chain
MAGQSPNRREFVQALSLAAVASGALGFSRWSFAFDGQIAGPGNAGDSGSLLAGGRYLPQFFPAQEYRTIEILTELIIPSHDGPGAKEAGVSEFVDFMVSRDASLHEPFRNGLSWLDNAAGHGQSFAHLHHAEQTQLLDRLAYKKLQRAQEKPGQEFFLLVRRYTVMGFYTTRIGLEALDYPGLTFYATSPGCPSEHSGHTGSEG